jgi:hypothetical protein
MVAAMLMCGCAHLGQPPGTEARIVGSYSVQDLLWSRTLHLNADRSFSFYQLSTFGEGSKDAAVRFEESWAVGGTWSLEPPDYIKLVSASRTVQASIRVRIDSSGRVHLVDADKLPTVLKGWDDASGAKVPLDTLSK